MHFGAVAKKPHQYIGDVLNSAHFGTSNLERGVLVHVTPSAAQDIVFLKERAKHFSPFYLLCLLLLVLLFDKLGMLFQFASVAGEHGLQFFDGESQRPIKCLNRFPQFIWPRQALFDAM